MRWRLERTYMPLSDVDKKKIEEEEKYRAKLREELHNKPAVKKGMGCGTIVLIILGIFVGLPLVLIILFFNFTSSQIDLETRQKNGVPLEGKVSFTEGIFNITNEENEHWTDCYAKVNDDYSFPSDINTHRFSIKPGETYSFGYEEVTKNEGLRFNPYSIKLKKLALSCGNRFELWTWD